jgi:HlyD family type I secretion membrane fusion protein
MSETVQERPASADYFIRLGFGAVAVLFGGVLFWSVVAPISAAVIAPGLVSVESNRKSIQHLDGGLIEELYVREGDKVDEGDLLARLDDTAAGANLALIDGQLTELYARRARLEAERDGLDIMAVTRGDAGVIATLQSAEKRDGQQQLFDARRQTKLTQLRLLEERVVQQKERITGLEAQISSSRRQRALIEDELKGVRELNEQGFAPLTRVRALERESSRLVGERGALRATVAEATSIIAEAQLEIERLRETDREDAITELRDVELSIAEREEKRVATAEILQRTEIKAPQAGRVIGLTVHTVGGVIAPGAVLMEIVPNNDRLQISAHVSPRDVDKLRTGQETLVRFSSLGGRATPEAQGVVRNISADSFIDKVTGASYYLVLVDIPQGEEIDKLLSGAALVPGMPVETFIRTGSRPAISYFLKPLTDALARSMREE